MTRGDVEVVGDHVVRPYDFHGCQPSDGDRAADDAEKR